jgi:hypothetical protein
VPATNSAIAEPPAVRLSRAKPTPQWQFGRCERPQRLLVEARRFRSPLDCTVPTAILSMSGAYSHHCSVWGANDRSAADIARSEFSGERLLPLHSRHSMGPAKRVANVGKQPSAWVSESGLAGKQPA